MADIIRKRLTQAKSEKGFTLIELLVVLVILGILLAIAVPSYLGFRDRAARNAAAADVRDAIPAMEAYYQDFGNYTGATYAKLKASYDQGLAPNANPATLAVSSTATTYCISATVGGHIRRVNGPGGQVTSGAVC